MKRISLQDFITRSNIIYNNKYNYSLVDKDLTTRKIIKVICPIHGEFETLCGSHLQGKSGCNKCFKDEKKKEFLKKSINIHSNKYDYSLVNYKNNDTKIKIICPIHGMFEQYPHHHVQGAGCKKCSNNQKKLNTNIFIDRSKEVHNNKYDYSLVDYKDANSKVKIICPIHGEFEQRPCDHMMGHRGCPKCGGTIKSNTKDFIEKSKKIHRDKYDYSLVEYDLCTDKIIIICPKHGNFSQRATSHLSGQGCPVCNQSKGENIIMNFLIDNKYKYIPQKTFHKCKNKSYLPFDFYLPDYNICIEFDGIQHFEPNIKFGEEEFKKTIYNDIIKNNFCKNNNINLLRIKYDENIIEKLKKYLNKYGNTIIQSIQEQRNFILCFSEFGK